MWFIIMLNFQIDEFPKVYQKHIQKRLDEMTFDPIEDEEFSSLNAKKNSFLSRCYEECFGVYGWISPNGTIYTCGFTSHDWIVQNVFNRNIEDFEKIYGRFSITNSSSEERVFRYVTRTTKKQIDSYYSMFSKLK